MPPQRADLLADAACPAYQVTRLQREAATLKRVGDEVFRVQQKLTSERTTREAAIVQVAIPSLWLAGARH